ncbi:hypothetical protein FQN55_004180 [Onygenales sp. PD_40]|nr:hypothetical protein FQN55_004180 [Onygenales sp. PD_40]
MAIFPHHEAGPSSLHHLRLNHYITFSYCAYDARYTNTRYTSSRSRQPSNIPEGYSSNDTIICVYPMGGQYGFLPRLLYYAALVFVILGQYQQWLVMGALASALSYAGSTAIHAMAPITSRRLAFDLDILGAWVVLGTGCLAFAALYICEAKFKVHKKNLVVVMIVYSWMILDLLLDQSTPPVFIAKIVANELNLMITKLPNQEGIASVGQWAPVVAASLVIIASLIKKGLKMHGAGKFPKDIPPELRKIGAIGNG